MSGGWILAIAAAIWLAGTFVGIALVYVGTRRKWPVVLKVLYPCTVCSRDLQQWLP